MSSDLQKSRRLVRVLVLAGAALALLSVHQYLTPPEAVHSVRTRVSSLLVSVFGPEAAFALPAFAAAVFFYGARFLWRRAPRKPTDRLWW